MCSIFDSCSRWWGFLKNEKKTRISKALVEDVPTYVTYILCLLKKYSALVFKRYSINLIP